MAENAPDGAFQMLPGALVPVYRSP